jgi:DNA polymerase III subunit delta'
MSAITEELPWHTGLWTQFHAAWKEHRWPHALLLHGPEGVGKAALARRLAMVLLCDRPSSDWGACYACSSCKLMHSATHPDFLTLAPEEDKQQISVDRIREGCAQLSLTSYRSGYKVAVIAPAHQMTIAAANSLLKTLEEPGPKTALILVTSRLGALLPTLRSRCQQVAVRVPPADVGMAWLAKSGKDISPQLLRFANGAPLRALEMVERFSNLWHEVNDDIAALISAKLDVTQIAKRWANDDLVDRLDCLDHWLGDRIRFAIVGTADSFTGTPLPSGVEQLNISRLYGCLDRLRALQTQLRRTALQRELAAAALLVELLEALSARRN